MYNITSQEEGFCLYQQLDVTVADVRFSWISETVFDQRVLQLFPTCTSFYTGGLCISCIPRAFLCTHFLYKLISHAICAQ